MRRKRSSSLSRSKAGLLASSLAAAVTSLGSGKGDVIWMDLSGLPAPQRSTALGTVSATSGTWYLLCVNVDAATPAEAVKTVTKSGPYNSNVLADLPAGTDLYFDTTYTSAYDAAWNYLSSSFGAVDESSGILSQKELVAKGAETFLASRFADAGYAIGPGSPALPKKDFAQTGGFHSTFVSQASPSYPGTFDPGTSGYAGFRFKRSGATHYGLLHLSLSSQGIIKLDAIAWETTPNTAISTLKPPPPPKIEAAMKPGAGTAKNVELSWTPEAGYAYTVEVSVDGANWTPGTGTLVTENGHTRYVEAASPGASKFFRVAVKRSP